MLMSSTSTAGATPIQSVEELTNRRDRVVQQLAALRERIAETDVSGLSAQRADAAADLASGQADVARLRTERDEAGATVRSTEADVVELEARRSQLVEELQTTAEVTETQLGILTDDLDGLDEARQLLDRDEELLTQVQLQVYTRGDPRQDAAIDELISPDDAAEPLRLRHAFDQVARHASELVASHLERIDEHQTSVANANEILTDAEIERDLARAEIGDVAPALAEARVTAAEARDTLAAVNAELAPAESAVGAAAARLAELDARLAATSNDRVVALEAEIQALEVKITEATNRPPPDPQPVATTTTPPVLPTLPPIPAGAPTGRAAVYTGEPGGFDRSAVAIKIDNRAPARPQAGLNQADLLFEVEVEGGISRFIAVFQSQLPSVVGPVRSARTTDADIVAALGRPVFAVSGMNNPTRDALAPLDGRTMVLLNGTVSTGKGEPAYFYRDGSRPRTHDLMTSAAELSRAYDSAAGTPQPLFTFGAQPMSGGLERRGASVNFGASFTSYEWDGRRYVKSTDGSPHRDARGARVTADNVVIQFVTNFTHPRTGSPEVVTVGAGAAWFLSGGQLVTGSWNRFSATSPFDYRTDTGARVTFRPGRTHVIMAPVGGVAML